MMDDRTSVIFEAALVHALTLWLPCLLFLAADRFKFWQQYRIWHMPPGVKKEKLATINDALDKKAFRDQLLSTFVMAPLFGFLLYPVLGWRGMELWTDTLPSWSICIRDVVIMILGCDTMFYWAHRALHTKALYPYHKQHHEYKLTNVWASEYFGFFDLVCNLAPGLIPGVLIGTHFQLLMFFTGLRGWQTVQSHAGYGLPFDPINIGPFKDGAARHYIHHSHNIGCYGDWTPFWDWVCGTDTQYRKLYHSKNSKGS